MSSMRDDSRNTWSGDRTRESIKIGSLQRIADACELMSQSWRTLVGERDQFQRLYEIQKQNNDRLWRSNCALRGQITRLRRKMEGGR